MCQIEVIRSSGLEKASTQARQSEKEKEPSP
jgi:hypothetical protein